MTQDITAQDFFCGAGGSSTALVAAGVKVIDAANHWPLALETHNTNHPNTRHHCADLQETPPSQFQRADIAWFSPSCTNHSLAKGKKRKNLAQQDLWGKTGIDPEEERSRATMHEVVEFTEYHRYEIVIVENVVDIRYWQHYDTWLQAMVNLGYDHKALYLNAQFFGVPQSRDRIYVVFWRKGNHIPDLDFRPPAFCERHGIIGAKQAWKKAPAAGKYGKHGQYLYRCPECNTVVEPFTIPAATVIDWSIPSTKIGDRKKPLEPKTMTRILKGLQKFAPKPITVDTANPGENGHFTSIDDQLPTQTTRQSHALVQPFLMSYYSRDNAQSGVNEPLPTIPTNNRHSLVTPFILSYMNQETPARSIDEPMYTIAGRNTPPLIIPPDPFMIVLKNSHSKDGQYTLPPRRLDEPLTTLVASASQHALITPFISGQYGNATNREVSEPMPAIVGVNKSALVTPKFLMAYYGSESTYAAIDEPMPTATTVLRHAMISPEDMIEECGFRMLEPEELKRGMSFPNEYVILGNKRQQVKQVGNAVAVKMASAIIERCVQSLVS